MRGSMISFLATAVIILGLTSADDNCSCYTATRTLIAPKCAPLTGCIRPMCIILKSTTIPGPNEDCTTTPTSTVIQPCPTKCVGGCGSAVTTITASEPCPITAASTTIAPVVSPTPTLKSCYTWTTGSAPLCPNVTDCITPDCIVLRTTTVPAVDPACPNTPTATFTPSCIPTCPGGCRTDLVMVAAEATPSS